ncbi:hypothetical protein BDK51DRAFT_25720, partial [Blyttiomyces helicus]
MVPKVWIGLATWPSSSLLDNLIINNFTIIQTAPNNTAQKVTERSQFVEKVEPGDLLVSVQTNGIPSSLADDIKTVIKDLTRESLEDLSIDATLALYNLKRLSASFGWVSSVCEDEITACLTLSPLSGSDPTEVTQRHVPDQKQTAFDAPGSSLLPALPLLDLLEWPAVPPSSSSDDTQPCSNPWDIDLDFLDHPAPVSNEVPADLAGPPPPPAPPPPLPPLTSPPWPADSFSLQGLGAGVGRPWPVNPLGTWQAPTFSSLAQNASANFSFPSGLANRPNYNPDFASLFPTGPSAMFNGMTPSFGVQSRGLQPLPPGVPPPPRPAPPPTSNGPKTPSNFSDGDVVDLTDVDDPDAEVEIVYAGVKRKSPETTGKDRRKPGKVANLKSPASSINSSPLTPKAHALAKRDPDSRFVSSRSGSPRPSTASSASSSSSVIDLTEVDSDEERRRPASADTCYGVVQTMIPQLDYEVYLNSGSEKEIRCSIQGDVGGSNKIC